MMGYDSRPVVPELLCNRSLANVPHYGYTSGLKWNLHPADPTENVSPGVGQTGEKIHCFCSCGNENCIFLWFYHFLFFIFLYVYIGRWSSEAPSDCHFFGSLL